MFYYRLELRYKQIRVLSFNAASFFERKVLMRAREFSTFFHIVSVNKKASTNEKSRKQKKESNEKTFIRRFESNNKMKRF